VVGLLPTILTFVLPYKRFATPCLVALARGYLNEPRVTYRETVRHNRSLIGYPVQPSTVEDGKTAPRPLSCAEQQQVDAPPNTQHHQPVIPPSLVWRFVGWLGGLTLSLDKAREMLLQQDPNSLCHRLAGNVALHKARSPDRLQALQTARQLLLVMPDWEECFDYKFFPRFATRSGFD
jgi:hypothetical protein